MSRSFSATCSQRIDITKTRQSHAAVHKIYAGRSKPAFFNFKFKPFQLVVAKPNNISKIAPIP